MAAVYAVYLSNRWNQIDDVALGVFSSEMKAIAYIKKYASKYYKKLDKDDLRCLEDINQTQGRETNFEIRLHDINPKFFG